MAGKRVLVTGAGRNLGRAIALAFAEAGADVIVNARSNRAEAESVAAEAERHGVRARALLADVSRRPDVETLMAGALKSFGGLDVLVNNAAVRPRQAFLEITPDEWERVLSTNLTAMFHTCRAALPGMVERGFGRIINISGADAFIGATRRAHSVTSKAGIIGLTRALAAEFGRCGVTANAVVPGLLDTSRDPQHYDANVLNAWRDGLPIPRDGKPEEIAALCVFLATDDAAYITGQSIHANGGGVMW